MKQPVRSTTLTADAYKVMDMALENGAARLPRRFSKACREDLARLLDDPEAKELIADVMMSEICEWFRFDEGDDK